MFMVSHNKRKVIILEKKINILNCKKGGGSLKHFNTESPQS